MKKDLRLIVREIVEDLGIMRDDMSMHTIAVTFLPRLVWQSRKNSVLDSQDFLDTTNLDPHVFKIQKEYGQLGQKRSFLSRKAVFARKSVQLLKRLLLELHSNKNSI
ncbi:hypothetical protein TNCV_1869541 [Trichonephila clavipes]|nr:hypothetical protein TNCV_1869541 [Trichonephila clavipes]